MLYGPAVDCVQSGRKPMTTRSTTALALVAGFAIGAAAVQALHAAAGPPAYLVTEISVSNLDA